MKKIILSIAIFISIFFSGCTQIVTAPIEIAGATVGAVIDVAGSAAHAVAGDDEDK